MGTPLDKKWMILKGAIKVFAKRGFHRARTAEVAKAASVAEGTIYNYFKGKDDLLVSIFEEVWGDFTRRLRAESSKLDDPAEKMALILDETFNLFENDPALAEVFLVELRQTNKIFSSRPTMVFLDFLELLEDTMREGIRDGIYRKDVNLQVLRAFLFGGVEGVLLAWLLSQTHPEYKRRKVSFSLRAARETLLKTFREGMGVR